MQIRYETQATGLLSEEGRVCGVRWKSFAGEGVIRARSVILAAGGFVMNAQMVAEHVPQLARQAVRPRHHL